MQHLNFQNLIWLKTPTPGIFKAEIQKNSEGGGLTFWRVPKEGGFPHHGHKGYEHIYLVKGSMNFSGELMHPGDFLLTSAGEEHEAIALEESIILVFNERKNS
jgi:quercetin dioxygenase-like cupin family protein